MNTATLIVADAKHAQLHGFAPSHFALNTSAIGARNALTTLPWLIVAGLTKIKLRGNVNINGKDICSGTGRCPLCPQKRT
jgi:hypothetical protein